MKLNIKKVVLVGALLLSVLGMAVWQSDCDKPEEQLTEASKPSVEQWKQTAAGPIPLDSIGRSRDTDESERSDRLTGGRIELAQLITGDRRIWLTVDIPAFRLTLWQNGKEVKTYPIGIGRSGFPLPVGERGASEIIWNPEWIPPDSSWVEENEDVEPGELITADDLRNPLGKIKIPLGGGILIHEAARRSDIGQLVSHGCVRMLTEDIGDLAEKIVRARGIPLNSEQLEGAKRSTERLAVKLDPPLWVDI
ncbi:MAG: L,D-transpeptidase, partial [Blastocatellia bacterium]|nr:L,D-transpeptidase [Blastocatellia bacterium]